MENVWDITVGMEDVNAVWLEMCEHVGKENDKLVLDMSAWLGVM